MNPIELNEHGLAVWRHRENRHVFVQRDYRWCDRVIILDELDGRCIIDDTLYSTFDFHDWIPVTVEQMKKVKRNYKEIYN